MKSVAQVHRENTIYFIFAFSSVFSSCLNATVLFSKACRWQSCAVLLVKQLLASCKTRNRSCVGWGKDKGWRQRKRFPSSLPSPSTSVLQPKTDFSQNISSLFLNPQDLVQWLPCKDARWWLCSSCSTVSLVSSREQRCSGDALSLRSFSGLSGVFSLFHCRARPWSPRNLETSLALYKQLPVEQLCQLLKCMQKKRVRDKVGHFSSWLPRCFILQPWSAGLKQWSYGIFKCILDNVIIISGWCWEIKFWWWFFKGSCQRRRKTELVYIACTSFFLLILAYNKIDFVSFSEPLKWFEEFSFLMLKGYNSIKILASDCWSL